jgi:hypothetical protein
MSCGCRHADYAPRIRRFDHGTKARAYACLTAGSKSGRLLIHKTGAVAILKNSIEIARVEEPRTVLGEISALLEKPHTADVRALEDSQFHVADAVRSIIGRLHPLHSRPWLIIQVTQCRCNNLDSAGSRTPSGQSRLSSIGVGIIVQLMVSKLTFFY